MAFTMEVVRLAKLAVALFGFDEAIVNNVVGQAEDILLTYSALGQLHDLLRKFELASLRLSSRDELQITEDWKNSFSELERRATNIRKICGNSSMEPLGIYPYDNVERQDEVSKGLNSIREKLQYHIQSLQDVIYDLDIRHNKPTDDQHDKPPDIQWAKNADTGNDEVMCASCENKERQLYRSHEAIKDLEQKCWALEIDRFGLKPNDNRGCDEMRTLYEELKNKWKQLGEEAGNKGKPLSLSATYVDILIERKEYLQAEEVAESIWEECKDEGTSDSRLIYRRYCKALRQQGPDKYGALVSLLRKTWPDADEKYQSEPPWALENGDELCSILELQGKFERAYALRKGLWEERGEKQDKKHQDTVQTGIWAAQCKIKERAANEKEWSTSQKEAAYDTAMEIFKKIWELWDPKIPSEADIGILTAGHLLGYLHFCRKEYADASRILKVVWERRKALLLFIQSPEDIMLTGHYLSQACFRLGDFSTAKSVFEEVWNAIKFVCRETSEDCVLNAYRLSIDCLENSSTTASDQNSVPETQRSDLPSETLKAWFEIGWALLNQEKYQNAVCILQEAYNAYRAAPQTESPDEDALLCGRYLGEAIARQGGRCLEAKAIIKNILDDRTLRGTTNEFEVLECRYLYGCLLKEIAESPNSEPGLFHEAEEELKKVWQTRNTPRLKRPKMLKAGRNLVSVLVISHEISDAQEVLSEVQEFEEQGSEQNSPESLAFSRSLGISLMRTKEFEMASKLFEKVWATRGGPPHSTAVLEDGYYLSFCRMKQQQNQNARDVLEEVEKLIGEAEVGDWTPLKKAVHDTLPSCSVTQKLGSVASGPRRKEGNAMLKGLRRASQKAQSPSRESHLSMPSPRPI